MKLAILFWFYKEPEICENRLQLLKKHNPDLKIFGLFGGKHEDAEEYKQKLSKYLDDFYICPEKDEDRKWMHGDLMLLDWYEKRGINLDWDSIAVVQWDMLVLDSLVGQFRGIKKDQIFLSGLRILDEEVESNWDWTQSGREERENYLSFLKYVKNRYNYTEKALCCLFILEVLPKLFFDKYLSVQDKEVGMLEYKVPTYAKIFDISFYEKDFGVRWFSKEEYPLNAIPEEIQENYINKELLKKDGWRIFHPYFKKWDI